MNRHAIKRLEQWKDSKGRKPMIIRGARQVGKTWLMKEFGRTRFAKSAYVNFENNDRAKAIFEMDFDIARMILALSAETGVDIQAEDTLLIFDEIQEAPKALTSLKYFYENAPQYCIVAAGSLLGVAIHHGTSFPVGKVDFMDLYPLSYTEFLEALGEERFAKLLAAGDTEMMRVFKSKFIERLKEYYFVGGMPEAVLTFVENNFPFGFAKTKTSKITPRVRFEALSVGVALALRQNPTLTVSNVDWMKSDEFRRLTTSDASNNQGKLKERVEYVRDQLLKDALPNE